MQETVEVAAVEVVAEAAHAVAALRKTMTLMPTEAPAMAVKAPLSQTRRASLS